MAVKSYALTTRQRLIDFLDLGTVSDTTKQNVLDRIIDLVTEFVERYCGRRFKQTAYTNQLYDGDDSQIIILKNYPINSSSTFTIQRRSSDLNEDDWEDVDTEYYHVDYDAGIVYGAGTYQFIRGRQRYRVTYTAGYDYDNAATFLSNTIGGELEYAVWRLCAACWNRRKGDPGIESEKLGDYAVTLSKSLWETPEIKEILDKHARSSLGSAMTPLHTSGAYEK